MKLAGSYFTKIALAGFAAVFFAVAFNAQEMNQHPTVLSTKLQIEGLDGKGITLSPEEFAGLPHKTVSVFNAHSKTDERYSGVPLADLLAKAGVPLGEKVQGNLFLTGIIAEGTDNYDVLYSLAEVDPSLHAVDVIVSDSMDGHALGNDGFFKLVSTEEKRPARWVRNLASIKVIAVKP